MTTAFFPTKLMPVRDENQIPGILLNYQVQNDRIEIKIEFPNRKNKVRYLYLARWNEAEPDHIIFASMPYILKEIAAFIHKEHPQPQSREYYVKMNFWKQSRP